MELVFVVSEAKKHVSFSIIKPTQAPATAIASGSSSASGGKGARDKINMEGKGWSKWQSIDRIDVEDRTGSSEYKGNHGTSRYGGSHCVGGF